VKVIFQVLLRGINHIRIDQGDRAEPSITHKGIDYVLRSVKAGKIGTVGQHGHIVPTAVQSKPLGWLR
jgi:hypothetical protein